jgi:urease accessory protein
MKLWRGLPFLLLVMVPQPVSAHGGIGNGLMAGLAHPVGGWDHLLAMVAVGIISTKIGGRAVWGAPLLFLLGMAAGYRLGLQQVIVPCTEWGILLSVLGLGLLLAWPQRPLPWLVALLVLLFGLSHGYAHGSEWPQQASAWWFSLGFLGTTTGLHLIGVILGLLFNQAEQPFRSFALAGSGITTAGVILMFIYSV